MAFERVQGIVILHRVVVIAREVSFKLDVLQGFWSIALHDLLHVIDDGFRS
jgi:hypothetical protein